MRYCGTAAKAGGNGENKLHPAVRERSWLLEGDGILGFGRMEYWGSAPKRPSFQFPISIIPQI
jgi:hypothetical protein